MAVKYLCDWCNGSVPGIMEFVNVTVSGPTDQDRLAAKSRDDAWAPSTAQAIGSQMKRWQVCKKCADKFVRDKDTEANTRTG